MALKLSLRTVWVVWYCCVACVPLGCQGGEPDRRGRRTIDELINDFQLYYSTGNVRGMREVLAEDELENYLAEVPESLREDVSIDLEIVDVTQERNGYSVTTEALITERGNLATEVALAFTCRKVGANYIISRITDISAKKIELLMESAEAFADELLEALQQPKRDWRNIAKILKLPEHRGAGAESYEELFDALGWNWLNKAGVTHPIEGYSIVRRCEKQADIAYETENQDYQVMFWFGDAQLTVNAPNNFWALVSNDAVQLGLVISLEDGLGTALLEDGETRVNVKTDVPYFVKAPIPFLIMLAKKDGSSELLNVQRPGAGLGSLSVAEFVELVESVDRWRRTDSPLARRVFLLRTLRHVVLKELVAETARELVRTGYFRSALPEGEVERWVEVIADRDISGVNRSMALELVGPHFGCRLNAFLLSALQDENEAMLYAAAGVLENISPSLLENELREWLQDKKHIRRALVLISEGFADDEDVTEKCARSMRTWSATEFCEYAPLLLSSSERKIQAEFEKRLRRKGHLAEKRCVLRSLTGANPPKGIDKEAILSAVKAAWSVPHPERIRSVVRGLLYLKDCGYGPAVRYAQSVLEDIEDTDEAEQVFAVVLIQTGQKFDSIEELEHWMKSD